mgnify:CR=1 FL=1
MCAVLYNTKFISTSHTSLSLPHIHVYPYLTYKFISTSHTSLSLPHIQDYPYLTYKFISTSYTSLWMTLIPCMFSIPYYINQSKRRVHSTNLFTSDKHSNYANSNTDYIKTTHFYVFGRYTDLNTTLKTFKIIHYLPVHCKIINCRQQRGHKPYLVYV